MLFSSLHVFPWFEGKFLIKSSISNEPSLISLSRALSFDNNSSILGFNSDQYITLIYYECAETVLWLYQKEKVID